MQPIARIDNERIKRIKMSEKIRYRTRLKEYREKEGLTRMDLVRDLKISYPTVAAWEETTLVRMDARIIQQVLSLFKLTYPQLVYTVKIDDDGNETVMEDGAA